MSHYTTTGLHVEPTILYMSQAQKRDLKKTMRFGAFVIFGGSDLDASRFADESWWFQCACAVVFPPEDWSRQSRCHYGMSRGSLVL